MKVYRYAFFTYLFGYNRVWIIDKKAENKRFSGSVFSWKNGIKIATKEITDRGKIY